MFSKTGSKPTATTAPDVRKQNSNRSPARDMSNAPSILSRDLVVKGNLETKGDIQIEGSIKGNIKATTLTIGESGSVDGNIDAGKVLVRGKVKGKITADSVELTETANVKAEIIQDHLSIANGAFFDGTCSRKTKPAGTATTAKK